MRYKQLTLKERYHISALLKSGLKQKEIADEIGVHASTICRELKRNRDEIRGYSGDLAQIKSTKIQMQKKRNDTTHI